MINLHKYTKYYDENTADEKWWNLMLADLAKQSMWLWLHGHEMVLNTWKSANGIVVNKHGI